MNKRFFFFSACVKLLRTCCVVLTFDPWHYCARARSCTAGTHNNMLVYRMVQACWYRLCHTSQLAEEGSQHWTKLSPQHVLGLLRFNCHPHSLALSAQVRDNGTAMELLVNGKSCCESLQRQGGCSRVLLLWPVRLVEFHLPYLFVEHGNPQERSGGYEHSYTWAEAEAYGSSQV